MGDYSIEIYSYPNREPSPLGIGYERFLFCKNCEYGKEKNILHWAFW